MSVTVDRYTARITSEHRGKSKFLASVIAAVQPFVDLQNVLAVLNDTSFDLDVAVGAQLDAVGVRIGFSRFLTVSLSNVFFSWDIPGLGWDQGFWEGKFEATTGVVSLDDLTYRALLRIKIAANAWDGTNETFPTLLPIALLPAQNKLNYLDNQDGSITIVITGPVLPPLIAAIVTGGAANYKPAGIQLTYVITTTVGTSGPPFTIPTTIPV